MTPAWMLSIADPQSIPAALRVLSDGGLVCFPTDTVYGLAASLTHPAAIERIYAAKGRDNTKALAVLVASVEQLTQVTPGLTASASRLARHFWPGALTLVVPRLSSLPAGLSPYPTVGVRMPDHPAALALLSATGPLATTSANLSGQPDSLTADQVMQALGDVVDLILDGGRTSGGIPSTVVDCTREDITILRQGAIAEADIRQVLSLPAK